MAYPQVAEGADDLMWRVAANILNEQLQGAYKG
jgi:hypothetical protein